MNKKKKATSKKKKTTKKEITHTQIHTHAKGKEGNEKKSTQRDILTHPQTHLHNPDDPFRFFSFLSFSILSFKASSNESSSFPHFFLLPSLVSRKSFFFASPTPRLCPSLTFLSYKIRYRCEIRETREGQEQPHTPIHVRLCNAYTQMIRNETKKNIKSKEKNNKNNLVGYRNKH